MMVWGAELKRNGSPPKSPIADLRVLTKERRTNPFGSILHSRTFRGPLVFSSQSDFVQIHYTSIRQF